MTRADSGLVISTSAIRRALVLLVLLAVVAGAVYLGRTFVGRSPAAAEHIDHGAYQAVFLTNGQVFYGKLTIPDGDTYLLTDVYYLVTGDAGQAGRLVKRGGEVQGPREPMVILAKQVLWFENMRDDSEVAGGIRAIRSGQGGPAPTVAPVAPTPRPSASR